MKSFWLELKSSLKGFKFIAFILVLLSYQAMLVSQLQSEAAAADISTLRANERYYSENISWVEYWEEQCAKIQDGELPGNSIYAPQTVENSVVWYRYEKKLADNIHKSYISKDWSTYNRHMAEKKLLEWNLHRRVYDAFMDYTNPYIVPLLSPLQYFGESWEHFNALIDDPDFSFLPAFFADRIGFNQEPIPIFPYHQYLETAMATNYYLHLLDADLPPMEPHSTSAWGFAVNYLRRGLPNILALVVMLMTVNILHLDKKFGTIKSTLQLPKGRSFYLFRKVAQGFVTSILVVAIPQFIMFIILGADQGYKGFSFPLLIDNGFFNWSVLPDHLDYTLQGTPILKIGLSQYQLPWSIFVPGLSRLEFIPLWQYLCLASCFLAVFVLFCSVLGTLISTLVRYEIWAQIAALVIFVMGSGFSTCFPNLATTSWDLFSKADVVPLLEGSHYSTYLNSMTVLGLASVILFGLCTLIFRKQDITAC